MVTGGTGAFLRENLYQAAIDVVVATCRSWLVVTPYKDLLPESMPENCLWSPSLPFSQLIPQTAFVIHHGGIGTLAAAARAGIPQLILAYGADRPDNGQQLIAFGVGVVEPLPRWQAGVLSKHLYHLIPSDEVAEQCANIIRRIKVRDGA